MSTFQYNAGDPAPLNEKASDSLKYCYECGRKLGKSSYYFEVSTGWMLLVIGSDPDNSQGCFPVGSECAKKFAPEVLRKFAKAGA
jgi:hypothetical protein